MNDIELRLTPQTGINGAGARGVVRNEFVAADVVHHAASLVFNATTWPLCNEAALGIVEINLATRNNNLRIELLRMLAGVFCVFLLRHEATLLCNSNSPFGMDIAYYGVIHQYWGANE
jgi:hypothetical protein